MVPEIPQNGDIQKAVIIGDVFHGEFNYHNQSLLPWEISIT